MLALPKLIINNTEVLKNAIRTDDSTVSATMYHDSLVWRIIALDVNELCLPTIFVTSDRHLVGLLKKPNKTWFPVTSVLQSGLQLLMFLGPMLGIYLSCMLSQSNYYQSRKWWAKQAHLKILWTRTWHIYKLRG